MKRELYLELAADWQHMAECDYKEMCIARNDGNVRRTIIHQHAMAIASEFARLYLFKLIGNGETE